MRANREELVGNAVSDAYESEMNPDDEPGERLQEALRGADADDHDADGELAREGAAERLRLERLRQEREG